MHKHCRLLQYQPRTLNARIEISVSWFDNLHDVFWIDIHDGKTEVEALEIEESGCLHGRQRILNRSKQSRGLSMNHFSGKAGSRVQVSQPTQAGRTFTMVRAGQHIGEKNFSITRSTQYIMGPPYLYLVGKREGFADWLQFALIVVAQHSLLLRCQHCWEGRGSTRTLCGSKTVKKHEQKGQLHAC